MRSASRKDDDAGSSKWRFASKAKSTRGERKEELSLLERYVKEAPWKTGGRGERGQGDKYLFTLRSNVMYSGQYDPDPCVYGEALDILPNDYVKIVAVVDEFWWVGRLVGGSAVCKYVPSPKCFLAKHKASRFKPARGDHADDDGAGAAQADAPSLRNRPPTKKSVKYKQPPFTQRPVRTIPVYDLAPDVRPLVIVGPSAPGFEVTDKMQNALISYLLMSFSRHCVKVVVDEEPLAGKSLKGKNAGSGGSLTLSAEKMNEIFLIGSSGRIPILITVHQNIESLRFSPLMPIIVQIRVPSTKVLSKLIKTRPDQTNLQAQLNYTEKLNTMNHNMFDVTLVHSKLDESCYELAAYVDAYLSDIKTEPVIDAKVWHAVDQATSNWPAAGGMLNHNLSLDSGAASGDADDGAYGDVHGASSYATGGDRAARLPLVAEEQPMSI